MLKWSLEKKHLELKFDWKISRASEKFKENYFIKVTDGQSIGVGEIAFNKRYNESCQLIETVFATFLNSNIEKLSNISEFKNVLKNIVGIPNSLRFGLESSFVHYLASAKNMSVSNFLGVNDLNKIKISFSIPIIPISEIKEFIYKFNLNRFEMLKLKVNEKMVIERVIEVTKYFKGKLCLDFNEAITDPDLVIYISKKLKRYPIVFIEQPLPSSMFNEYEYLKNHIDQKIMADESVTDQLVTEDFVNKFDGVNIKLMKSGGYLNALEQLKSAKNIGMEVMFGSMVETSLGALSVMSLGPGGDYFDLDGFLFLKKDPFNFVYEQDGEIFKNNY